MPIVDRTDAPGRVWHVTARINWRKWHLHDEGAYACLVAELVEAAGHFDIEVLAFVAMSNHYHLVVRCPDEDRYRELTSYRTKCRHILPCPPRSPRSTVVGQFVRRFHLAVSRRIHAFHDLSGHLWEKRHHRRCVGDVFDLCWTIAYDHRNPTREGMAPRPEAYPRSSAAWWAGCGHAPVPLLASGSLPFDADLDEFRESLLYYQSSRAFEDAFSAMRASGLAPDSLEGRADLERRLRKAGVPLGPFARRRGSSGARFRARGAAPA